MKLLEGYNNGIPIVYLVTDGYVENEREICYAMKECCSRKEKRISPRMCTFSLVTEPRNRRNDDHDIVLDQVSDCSSYGIMSRRETLKKEEEEEEEDDHHHNLPQNPQKSKSLYEESLVVVKLEISDRFSDLNREVNKRKVLERLDSDLQKLANLHVVVEDLKTKVEKEKKSEYETVKEQIHEAEDALEKLLSVNRKLMTKVRSGFERSESSMDLDENESSSRRRRISEQARRGSEKIGRLQFLLLKLEGQREDDKVKADKAKRTLLRDYIYGGGVRGERRRRIKKRFAFFGFVQQPPPP